jgi:hypothetical protein
MYGIIFINIFNKKKAVLVSYHRTRISAKVELTKINRIVLTDLVAYKYTGPIWEDEDDITPVEDVYCFDTLYDIQSARTCHKNLYIIIYLHRIDDWYIKKALIEVGKQYKMHIMKNTDIYNASEDLETQRVSFYNIYPSTSVSNLINLFIL